MGGMISVPRHEWDDLNQRVEDVEYRLRVIGSNPVLKSIFNYVRYMQESVDHLEGEVDHYREEYDRVLTNGNKNAKKLACTVLMGAVEGKIGVGGEKDGIE